MTFEEYHEINRKYGCYEDMIRDFLQSGLVVRCLPPKEDYS